MFEADLNENHARLDRLQLVAVLGLMLVGAVFVYSATMINDTARSLPLFYQSYFRQIVWYLVGLGATKPLKNKENGWAKRKCWEVSIGLMIKIREIFKQ